MSVVDHGIPVVSSRQWTTALSPNAAGDGWNYIVQTGIGEINPYQFTVLKDLTGVHGDPAATTYDGISGIYTNTLFALGTAHGQIRAANGRIFFPEYKLYLSYYDPTTEQVHQIGPLAESPPIDQNASTIFYSASFDVAGQLYFATQESHFRPSCVVQMDPSTLTQTVLGYVGSGALAYTTYGYRIAPDTATATKYIYVAYGQDPWQLWALNVSTGVTTKLYEVTSTGNIQFTNISGKGWMATVDTNLGQPSNVRTQWWCLDGALYAYSVGVDPPGGLARNVTPASNPLSSPPSVDTSVGAGLVGWRTSSSDPYTYVPYTVSNSAPVAIESLIASNDGILGNAEQYNGFFRFEEPSDNRVWYGPFAGISEGPRLNVGGIVYMAGYPNGVLYRFDPTSAWAPSATTPNPKNLGNYGLHGNLYAGIKYADCLAWSAATSRLYCAGSRERNGSGMGIGYYDTGSQSFDGTYSLSGMSSALPVGLVYDDTLDIAIVSARPIAGGDASIMVFSSDLGTVHTYTPIPGATNLGPIYPTTNPGVVFGLYQSGSSIVLYLFDALSGIVYTSTSDVTGTLGPYDASTEIYYFARQANGTVWATVDNTLVKIDGGSLAVIQEHDITDAMPVSKMAFASDGITLFMAGGSPSGVDGAELYSIDTSGFTGGSMSTDVPRSSLTTQQLMELGNYKRQFADALDSAFGDISFLDDKLLTNAEATSIIACSPVYISGSGTVKLAKADALSTSYMVGLVTDDSIAAGASGRVRTTDCLEATTAQWDAVCGTTGGLVPDTTYYLSDSTAGRLTVTPPSTAAHTLVPAIVALTSTTARLVFTRPILL